MKKNRKQKKYLKLLLIILIVLTLGIGYALLTQKLIIGGNLIYGTIKWDVGYKVATDGGGTVSSNPSISNDKKTITINCNVGTSTNEETCIVNTTIENNSTFAVQLEQKPKITYDPIYVDSINVVWADDSTNVSSLDIIEANSIKEVKIVIKTKELSNDIMPTTGLDIPVKVDMNWVEKDKVPEYTVLIANEDFINGTHYYDGTLKTGSPYALLKTTTEFLEPQKIKIMIEDSMNDVSTQKYRVVYSAYDSSGQILNPNDTKNAMFYINSESIELDLPALYPTGAKFRVDIMRFDGTEFYQIPSTATITVVTAQ